MVAAGDPPRVTVLIPTHDHASTLDLAIGSVLGQTWEHLELVVVGDGVGNDTRAVVGACDDPRLRFLDVPKSASRAEEVRHQLLTETSSALICYLGDDDLMLPDHVATMVDLLADADFAHPLPAPIAPDGTFVPHSVDLADERWRAWHMHFGRNAVSLTGVAHRVDAYRRLPTGWQPPPPGRPSDHTMWQQWFVTPGFRYRTGTRLTVLKLDSVLRVGWTPEDRRAELLEWWDRSRSEGFALWLDRAVFAAYADQAAVLRVERYGWGPVEPAVEPVVEPGAAPSEASRRVSDTGSGAAPAGGGASPGDRGTGPVSSPRRRSPGWFGRRSSAGG